MKGTEEKIINLLKQYNIPYVTPGQDKHVRPGWIGIHCPFCMTIDKWHMGISTSYLNCHCWQCGGHSFYDTLRATESKILFEDIKSIKDGIFFVKSRFDNRHNGKFTPPRDISDLTKDHKKYLVEERGINIGGDFDKLWGLKSIGFGGGDYKFRIFMPINIGHEPVSFTTRRTHPGGLRYLSAKPAEETIRHKKLLYGEDYVKSTVVVVEGPMDVIKIGPGAVGTFGVEYSLSQVRRIARYPKRYICFDNEPQAQIRAEGLANALMTQPGKTYVIKINAKDPGSAPESELQILRKLIDS